MTASLILHNKLGALYTKAKDAKTITISVEHIEYYFTQGFINDYR